MENQRPRIGLIFADPNLRKVAARLLMDHGFEVRFFSSREETGKYRSELAAVLAESGPEDLNYCLPAELFPNLPGVPVILISTFVSRCSLAGGVRVYPASFNWKQIISDLRACLRDSDRGREAQTLPAFAGAG